MGRSYIGRYRQSYARDDRYSTDDLQQHSSGSAYPDYCTNRRDRDIYLPMAEFGKRDYMDKYKRGNRPGIYTSGTDCQYILQENSDQRDIHSKQFSGTDNSVAYNYAGTASR